MTTGLRLSSPAAAAPATASAVPTDTLSTLTTPSLNAVRFSMVMPPQRSRIHSCQRRGGRFVPADSFQMSGMVAQRRVTPVWFRAWRADENDAIPLWLWPRHPRRLGGVASLGPNAEIRRLAHPQAA